MKINTSHIVGAAIALVAVFFSKLDAQDAPAKAEHQKWEYATIRITDTAQDRMLLMATPEMPDGPDWSNGKPTLPYGLFVDVGRSYDATLKVLNIMGNEGWEVYRITKSELPQPLSDMYEEIIDFKRPKQ